MFILIHFVPCPNVKLPHLGMLKCLVCRSASSGRGLIMELSKNKTVCEERRVMCLSWFAPHFHQQHQINFWLMSDGFVQELTDWQKCRLFRWNLCVIIIILLFKCMRKCFAAGTSHAFIEGPHFVFWLRCRYSRWLQSNNNYCVNICRESRLLRSVS